MALTGLNPIPPNDLVMGRPPACGGRGSFAKLILSWDLPDVTWLVPPLLKTYDCRVSDLFCFFTIIPIERYFVIKCLQL